MIEYIDLVFWPLIAAFVLTGIHVYLGLQVVTRGVIFVDLALAQAAALGTTVGILLGMSHEGIPIYLLAGAFTLIGAVLFTSTRTHDDRVPQEAIIGITYVGATALMILLFSKSPEGAEHINHLLVGSILFVTPDIVGKTFLLYAVIGLFHWRYQKEFMNASKAPLKTTENTANTRLWDFLFYVTFGFVVTVSVKIAGVLLVFSFLIIPAVAAILLLERTLSRLLFGWIFGVLGSLLGMIASIILDFPSGASIVVTFALMLCFVGIIKAIKSKTS